MTDDDDLGQDNEAVCNPFLMQAADDDAPVEDTGDAADNPFFADAKNPFADFGGGDEAPMAIDDNMGVSVHFAYILYSFKLVTDTLTFF